jgi:hypothetical protein
MANLAHKPMFKEREMGKTAIMGLAFIVVFCPLLSNANEYSTPQLSYCWANGVIYGILLPSETKTSDGLRNVLYVFKNLNGQRPVAEAGPGEYNFQNGRFSVAFLEFTPKGISALDPNNDGICEFEITNAKMVNSYIDLGYLKLAGRGAQIDCKVVSPELYLSPKLSADTLRENHK